MNRLLWVFLLVLFGVLVVGHSQRSLAMPAPLGSTEVEPICFLETANQQRFDLSILCGNSAASDRASIELGYQVQDLKKLIATKRCTQCALAGADLAGLNLRAVDLVNSDLRNADLRGTDLSQANLAGSNLAGANLQGANLDNANLDNTNLRGALLP